MKAVLTMASTVPKLERKIGYKFKNAHYLWEAVQGPGAVIRSGEVLGAGTERHSRGFERIPDGNRRLAILGDKVLELSLVEDWYKGNEVRRRISTILSDVASNKNLRRVGQTHGLHQLINRTPSEIGRPNTHVDVPGTVEAIIGAVYLDSDMQTVTKVIQDLGLKPKLVRRPEIKVPVSESVKSSAVSKFFDEHREARKTAGRAARVILRGIMFSYCQIREALRGLLLLGQLKELLDKNTRKEEAALFEPTDFSHCLKKSIDIIQEVLHDCLWMGQIYHRLEEN